MKSCIIVGLSFPFSLLSVRRATRKAERVRLLLFNLPRETMDQASSSSAAATSPSTAAAHSSSASSSKLRVQDLSKLKVDELSPLSPEVISRQATINIGTIGHVAHGKSTIVKALTGVQVCFHRKHRRAFAQSLFIRRFGSRPSWNATLPLSLAMRMPSCTSARMTSAHGQTAIAPTGVPRRTRRRAKSVAARWAFNGTEREGQGG